jgi:hypothetical protein
MVDSKRKRGGQPANRNALKHGRYSAPLRASRRSEILAALEEHERKSREWVMSCPTTDYTAIAESLSALRRQREAARMTNMTRGYRVTGEAQYRRQRLRKR